MCSWVDNHQLCNIFQNKILFRIYILWGMSSEFLCWGRCRSCLPHSKHNLIGNRQLYNIFPYIFRIGICILSDMNLMFLDSDMYRFVLPHPRHNSLDSRQLCNIYPCIFHIRINIPWDNSRIFLGWGRLCNYHTWLRCPINMFWLRFPVPLNHNPYIPRRDWE